MPRTAREPKLRSSCDGCGTAKLKCDRGQPVCGRCQSLDLVCVYGVSRKTGKPPRETLRASQVPDSSCTCANAGSADQEKRDDSGSRGTAGYGYDGIALDPEQILAGHCSSLGMSVNPSDTTHTDLFWPLLPNFTPLGFDDGLFSDMGTGSIPTLTTSETESYAPPATEPDAPPAQADDKKEKDMDSVLLQSANSKGHDCFRETLDILTSLSSYYRLNDAHSTTEKSAMDSASTTARTATPVALDHVLRLNRDASERLDRLMTCSCAGLPQLTMLYASIISHVLVGYQHAAACTQSASWNSADTRLNTPPASHHPSLKSSTPSGSATWPSTWSSTAASISGAGGIEKSLPSIPPLEPVASAKMVIGTFDIDDLRVQTALKIQLLSGEVKRVGRLIDHFALQNLDDRCMTDEYTFSGVHQCLDAWLRSEHSRIANMMKAKLREYNT
ncbi:MAG: hypothetical protein Q9208_005908 [Pyrenodesmia sp. 3 TL-2023]